MTSTERAVRKASGERLLRDFARAARRVAEFQTSPCANERDWFIALAQYETSRTRYACLMTAFGQ